ncbi:flagellar export protein FliJ [Candidatus Desantisbacteria bacterium]|nr:flagellar export protein FliJ [Candidatus Desantisbacteria bacterium]
MNHAKNTRINMARFDFKFQHILNIRKHKENILQEDLSQLKRSFQHEESVLWGMEDKTRECLFKLKELQAELTSIREILDYHNYLGSLEKDIAAQKTRLESLSIEIDDTLSKLIHASQERKILEKLRERKWNEWKLEDNKEDQEFMDEIASISHERN